jgi:vesicular inhibitory amino acid transporter
MLGIETSPSRSSPEHDTKVPVSTSTSHTKRQTFKLIFTVIERVVFTFLSVGVSILIPGFSSAMAFLGSFSAFMLCVIGPVLAKRALLGWGVWDALLLIIAVVMATWGTIAAFWP